MVKHLQKLSAAPHHLIQFDVLRIIGAIGVISIHVNNAGIASFAQGHPLTFIVACIAHIFSMFGVNIFFLISGALILSKNEPWQKFYQKRVMKVVIPFFFWLLILSIIGNTDVLWFLKVIIICYLFTPILRAWLAQAEKKQILVFIIAILLIVIISKPLSFLGFETLVTGFFIDHSTLLLGLGLYVLGYYLQKYPLPKNFPTTLLGLILFGLFTITAGVTIALSYFIGASFRFFYNHEALPSILSAMLIFWLVAKNTSYLTSLSLATKKLIKTISDATLGIYLIHVAVIGQISPIVWEYLPSIPFFLLNLVVKISLMTSATFLISLVIILVIKKVPLLKHLV
jgi:surface polysaccharide O-acyltransferase-like enzyme